MGQGTARAQPCSKGNQCKSTPADTSQRVPEGPVHQTQIKTTAKRTTFCSRAEHFEHFEHLNTGQRGERCQLSLSKVHGYRSNSWSVFYSPECYVPSLLAMRGILASVSITGCISSICPSLRPAALARAPRTLRHSPRQSTWARVTSRV